jgi:HAD superfamily hydrolase (TIGR01490 family)
MKVAIFDLDGTLITVETLPFMLKAWSKLGYSKVTQVKVTIQVLFLYAIYKSGISSRFDKENFRRIGTEKFLKLFIGMNESEIKDFCRSCLEMLGENYNEKVVERFHLLRSEGYQMILLSGGYLPFVECVGNHFGFNEIIGSDIRFTEKGYIDYSDPIEVIMGKKKLSTLKARFKNVEIDWERSIALADSYYDIEILSHVGHPVAVTPDSSLKEYAIDVGWEIIE